MENGPGLKTYSLLKMGDFPASYVCLPECNFYDPLIKSIVRPYFLLGGGGIGGGGIEFTLIFCSEWLVGRCVFFQDEPHMYVAGSGVYKRLVREKQEEIESPAFLHQKMVLLENGSARWWNTRRLYK